MRTSRISQDTTRIFNSLSPNSRPARSTRSATKTHGLATFALGYDGTQIKTDIEDVEAPPSPPSQSPSPALSPSPAPTSRKRKRASSSTPVKSMVTHTQTWTSPRRQNPDQLDPSSQSPTRSQSLPKLPAKRSTSPAGTVRYTPPSNWDLIYDTVRSYREANPNAPVDTMGCEDLFWQAAPPKQQRYHTLTALMLSSQTKDTVTAVAMQRLHTELLHDPPKDPDTDKILNSCLTVENILHADPVHLDSLIGKVGFHNTKTKNIQRVAKILRDQYHDDIPNTVEGLMELPGVGPKMAYLCMSAAWKEDIGIGVDVHVHRITNMWGWHSTKTPEQTREWLEGWLPPDRWHHINKMLVGLGQTVCLPIGRRCGECPLAGKRLCKAEIKGWVKKEERKKSKIKTEHIEVEVEQDVAVVKSEDGGLMQESKLQIKQEPVSQ